MFSSVYVAFNGIGTKLRGEPVYFFAKWNDGLKTPLIGLAISTFLALAHLLFSLISHIVKGKASKIPSKDGKKLD